MSHTYPNGDQVHNVTVVFLAREWQGTPFPADRENLDHRPRSPDSLGMSGITGSAAPSAVPSLTIQRGQKLTGNEGK